MVDVATRCNSCTHVVVCSKTKQYTSARKSLEESFYSVDDKRMAYFKDSKDIIVSIKCPFYSEVPSYITTIKAGLRAVDAETKN